MFWDTSQFGLFSFSFFKFSYNWGRKKLINFHIDSPPIQFECDSGTMYKVSAQMYWPRIVVSFQF